MAIIAIITSNKLDFLGSSSIYHPVTNGRRNQIPITESISKTQKIQIRLHYLKKTSFSRQILHFFCKMVFYTLTHPACIWISGALRGDFGLYWGGRSEGGKLFN